MFGAKFLATEYSTGAKHAGRIDSLALDEDDNPVIIENKVVESSYLINQSLFYLSWLNDHEAEFEKLVTARLGAKAKVDWETVRVICIAPGFKEYDLHAVEMMGANIELWQFAYHDDEILNLEKIYPKTDILRSNQPNEQFKNSVMVEAGRKAAETRKTAQHTFEQHLVGKDEKSSLLSERSKSLHYSSVTQ